MLYETKFCQVQRCWTQDKVNCNRRKEGNLRFYRLRFAIRLSNRSGIPWKKTSRHEHTVTGDSGTNFHCLHRLLILWHWVWLSLLPSCHLEAFNKKALSMLPRCQKRTLTGTIWNLVSFAMKDSWSKGISEEINQPWSLLDYANFRRMAWSLTTMAASWVIWRASQDAKKGQCWWGGGGARYRWYGSRFLIQIHSKTGMSEYQRIDLLAVCQREKNELQLDNWIWAWRQPVAPKIAKKRPVDPLAPYVAPSGWSHHKVRSIAGLVERWPPIEPPTGLSISPKGHHLYSGHRDFSDRRFTPSNSWVCSPFKRYHNYLSVVCGYLFHLAVVPRYKASWENATLKMEVPGLCFFSCGFSGEYCLSMFIHVCGMQLSFVSSHLYFCRPGETNHSSPQVGFGPSSFMAPSPRSRRLRE